MDTALQWLHVTGLLVVLVVTSVIFVRGITLILRGKHHSVRFGLELLAGFGLLYYSLPPVLGYFDLNDYSVPVAKAAAFFWWVAFAYTLNAILDRFVWQGSLTDDGLRRVPKLLTDLVSLLVYAMAIMFVMHYVYEEPITAILASSGAVAFVIGLAAQPTIQEIFAGISLNTTKALRIGDFVEVDGVYGEVWEINWRSVALKSPNTGSLHIFPNSVIAKKIILNFSEPTDLFKYWISFHVEYSSSPDLVIRAIEEELENTRYVCRDPKPDFNILGFSSLGLEIRLRFWFEGDDPWWPAQNEACMAVWSGLRKKGIRLAIERFKLSSGDEFDLNPWVNEQAALPDKDCSDSLTNHPLLEGVAADAIAKLAQTARRCDYTPPDCVYDTSNADSYFYFVVDGDFAGYRVLESGGEARVMTYPKGSLFGVHALLSEGVENYKVGADTYGVLYRLDSSLLVEELEANSGFKTRLAKHLDDEQKIITKNLELHARNAARKARLDQHAALNIHLRDHVEDIFAKPIFHRLAHLISPRSKERDLIAAMMAASAIIANSRGNIDEVEKEYLRKNLGTIELFRHVESAVAISHFEQFAEQLKVGKKEAVLNKLRAISDEPKLSLLVIGIAHGMTSLHNEVLPEEDAALEEVASAMKSTASLEELLATHKQSPDLSATGRLRK
jgi:small-conductance mechanosensitive channel/CRP-like cAMP-binding protein